MSKVDGVEYEIAIGANSVEELCMEFLRSISVNGNLSVQPSKSGKPYAKLILTGGGIGGFSPSFSVEWPEVSIGGKQPAHANLTVVFADLQTAKAREQFKATRAATIKGDLAKMLREAQNLGVDVDDLLGNSAGE